MNKIGFLISEKENEYRRALIFEDLKNIKEIEMLYFQKGYFDIYGYCDDDIIKKGANVWDKDEIINKCDVIVDPKIGDSVDLNKIKNKIIYGWIHATQSKEITDVLIKNKITAYAWEKMFENNRHVFYRNNQIAGQAAVMHASICFGSSFYGKKVAVLGNGNSAFGAISTLSKLGAEIDVYPRKMEKLFKNNLSEYDLIVNCVLWDVNRKDHIIEKEDLKKLKKAGIIIDVSCDHDGAIETSTPTTIESPIYYVDKIAHYAVDHTPSLLHREASESLSKVNIKYINNLIADKINDVLNEAKIIKNGNILDQEINVYQGRS